MMSPVGVKQTCTPRFCGIQVEQSMGHETISMSLQKYGHSLKPITIDKSHCQCPEDALEEKVQD